jgi:hypothetical protein
MALRVAMAEDQIGWAVLGSLGNLASKSRLERTVFAAMAATLAVLSAYVALS